MLEWRIPYAISKWVFFKSDKEILATVRKIRRPYMPYVWKFVRLFMFDRPCVRKLRVRQVEWEDQRGFLKVGEIFVSRSFNGDHYFFDGYPWNVGHGYFEILSEEEKR